MTTDHARRLVTLEGWEWDPLILVRCIDQDWSCYPASGVRAGDMLRSELIVDHAAGWYPDLEDDGATRGILLGMLSRRVGAYCWVERAGHGERTLWAARSSSDDGTRDTLGTGSSWAEAFVRAWEATPPPA